MIYSHKPQRSGRSIQANTNNPPQDPPPPSKLIGSDDIPKVSYEIPDIPIENTIPPVPELCINEKLIIATTPSTKIIPKQKPKISITEKPQKEIPKISKSTITFAEPLIKSEPVIELPDIPDIEIPEISLFRRFLAKIKSVFGRK